MKPGPPLDEWIATRLGLAGHLTREALETHQLSRLRTSVAWAQQHSPFYRRQLAEVMPEQLTSLTELQNLPFTLPDDLRRNQPSLLCVSQSQISRVVTLETSGTSGPAKRLFFTEEEQAACLDFFQHGMSLLTQRGDRVLILFPCARPGSIGTLLASAVTRLGAIPMAVGPICDMAATLALIAREPPDVIAGTPGQLRSLLRCAPVNTRVARVLLSADQVAPQLCQELKQTWNCDVFEHYGMTEMGLGGGVDCAAHQGYHLREADLLFEIIDPQSGRTLAAGQSGEIVVTTLTRRGMPLIRYRTGDISRRLPSGCGCGSVLQRLAPLEQRVGSAIMLAPNAMLTMTELDQALFADPEISDCCATLRRGPPDTLDIVLAPSTRASTPRCTLLARARLALERNPAIVRAEADTGLCLRLELAMGPLCQPGPKRVIRTETL